MKILAFGQLTDHVASSGFEMDFVQDTDTLKERLYENYPGLKNLHFSIAVDKKIVNSNTHLAAGCEIALLPPFSGG
ncbi:MAG: MoaD/ThiS family protein [Cyclobacteriaceae bacterium]|nr:MoaD/ThiS family protein [Cyclobacteriaceae bacterium]